MSVQQLSRRLQVTGNALGALAVGAALYVVDGSLQFAVASAVVFLALNVVTDLADAVVGDYAGNAVFGLLVLAATGYFASLGSPWWFLLSLVLCGGWFALDGVQHLRYGVTRDEVGVPYRHEGSVLIGLPKALLARLAEPFVLGSQVERV